MRFARTLFHALNVATKGGDWSGRRLGYGACGVWACRRCH